MGKNLLGAFSGGMEQTNGQSQARSIQHGVIAIIITILVLELKMPHGAMFNDLAAAARSR